MCFGSAEEDEGDQFDENIFKSQVHKKHGGDNNLVKSERSISVSQDLNSILAAFKPEDMRKPNSTNNKKGFWNKIKNLFD